MLLDQVAGEVVTVAADGACDGGPSSAAVTARQADPPPDVVIPPRSPAVPGAAAGEVPRQRGRHVQVVREEGRMAWQKATGYGRRSLVDTGIGRYKASIGRGFAPAPCSISKAGPPSRSRRSTA